MFEADQKMHGKREERVQKVPFKPPRPRIEGSQRLVYPRQVVAKLNNVSSRS